MLKNVTIYYHNIVFFDQTKLHSVLVLALGYYDETDEKTSLPRIRIDFNEFAKIIK